MTIDANLNGREALEKVIQNARNIELPLFAALANPELVEAHIAHKCMSGVMFDMTHAQVLDAAGLINLGNDSYDNIKSKFSSLSQDQYVEIVDLVIGQCVDSI